MFVGARVLAGLGTGAESAIIAPFLVEFVPPARRGWFLGALAGFFSFGFVGAALIGRFVVPLGGTKWWCTSIAPPRTFSFAARPWPNTPDDGTSDAAPAAASVSRNWRLLVMAGLVLARSDHPRGLPGRR